LLCPPVLLYGFPRFKEHSFQSITFGFPRSMGHLASPKRRATSSQFTAFHQAAM